MMPNESVIVVRDLVVKYADRTILDHINLDITRGEVLVLLGGERFREEHASAASNWLGKAFIREHRCQRCGHCPLL